MRGTAVKKIREEAKAQVIRDHNGIAPRGAIEKLYRDKKKQYLAFRRRNNQPKFKPSRKERHEAKQNISVE